MKFETYFIGMGQMENEAKYRPIVRECANPKINYPNTQINNCAMKRLVPHWREIQQKTDFHSRKKEKKKK